MVISSRSTFNLLGLWRAGWRRSLSKRHFVPSYQARPQRLNVTTFAAGVVGLPERVSRTQDFMIDVMRHLAPGEEADVLTGLDALPDGARAAIPEVISRRPPQTIGIASPTDIEAFELTVEGQRLIKEVGWRSPTLGSELLRKGSNAVPDSSIVDGYVREQIDERGACQIGPLRSRGRRSLRTRSHQLAGVGHTVGDVSIGRSGGGHRCRAAVRG